MSFHRTIPGAGLVLVLLLLAVMLAACSGDPAESMKLNLTAADCAASDVRCYS